MRVTDLVAREHVRPDVILPSVTGQSEFRGNKGSCALSVQANRRTTFCEPADEVLPAHHNGDTAGPLEKKLLGRHQLGRLMATAESRCHHCYCASLREQGFGLRD
jgi:hypothetical protein